MDESERTRDKVIKASQGWREVAKERGESHGMLGRKRETDRGTSRGMCEKTRRSGFDEYHEEARKNRRRREIDRK